MNGNGRETNGSRSHTADGKFAPGNKCSKGGRLGVPNKATWIKEQLFERCTTEMLDELASGDRKLFWDVLCRIMPKQVQAEITGAEHFAEAATAAAERARRDGEIVRTRLGEEYNG